MADITNRTRIDIDLSTIHPAGTRIVYYIGFIAGELFEIAAELKKLRNLGFDDNHPVTEHLIEKRKKLNVIKDEYYLKAEIGIVHLTQRKLSNKVYEYIAIYR